MAGPEGATGTDIARELAVEIILAGYGPGGISGAELLSATAPAAVTDGYAQVVQLIGGGLRRSTPLHVLEASE